MYYAIKLIHDLNPALITYGRENNLSRETKCFMFFFCGENGKLLENSCREKSCKDDKASVVQLHIFLITFHYQQGIMTLTSRLTFFFNCMAKKHLFFLAPCYLYLATMHCVDCLSILSSKLCAVQYILPIGFHNNLGKTKTKWLKSKLFVDFQTVKHSWVVSSQSQKNWATDCFN